jgi:hypothetical protein
MLVVHHLKCEEYIERALVQFPLLTLLGVVTHQEQGGASQARRDQHKRQQEFGT